MIETKLMERREIAVSATGKTGISPGKLKFNSLLDKFVPQEKVGTALPHKVVMNRRLVKLDAAFAEFLEYTAPSIETEARLDCLKGIGCTAADVEQFSIVLAKYRERSDFEKYSGLFLSAMMNTSKDTEFVIPTGHLGVKISYIGYRNNGKKIRIAGRAGHYIGELMKNGEITVEGDAGECVGREMHGGIIIVKGNTGDYVGYQMGGGRTVVEGNVQDSAGEMMKGGIIVVKGNARRFVGRRMENGRIDVKGGIDSYSGWNMKGGKINVLGSAGQEPGFAMEGGIIRIMGKISFVTDRFKKGEIWQNGKLLAADGKVVGILNEGME
ncbi:Molybdenum-containing formylmethanofuran dehydrogenase 1 subunit C [uncultured archaeon]|nr:Molybdenum-containing formylmethanofuran dehydrogenase 1 subunit C [uncultured archaeon]